jgi:ABC-type multidrug transport system ATPase subunit
MEQVADSLLIIHKGRKIAEGSMNELLNPDQSRIELETRSAKELEILLKQTSWSGKIISANGQKLIMQMKREEVPAFIRQMAETKQDIFSIHKKNSLEDYFLALTSH